MTNDICTDNCSEGIPNRAKSNRLSTIFWGCIILWAGLVFLADGLGLLASLQAAGAGTLGFDLVRPGAAWSLVFLGAGIVFLVAALVRWLAPAYRRPGSGNLVIGAICLGIGIGDLFHWVYIWPLLLVLLGASFLAGALLKRQS